MRKVLIILAVLILSVVSAGIAQAVTLNWVVPTTYNDHTTPLPAGEIREFVFFNHINDEYTEITKVPGDQNSTQLTLPQGHYCFVGYAVTMANIPGVYSNEACINTNAPDVFQLNITFER